MTKKDLVNSLSQVKEDTIARLMTNGARLEAEEEAIVAANPLLRHITPHLQVWLKKNKKELNFSMDICCGKLINIY